MTAPVIPVDVVLLMLLVLVIADLTDALEGARQAVAEEQDSHAAYRLANPPRRAAQ